MFDSLNFAKKLEDVGLSREQAEVFVGTLVENLNNNFATKQDIKELSIATKRDISDLAVATKQDIKELAAETKQDIKNLENWAGNEFEKINLRFENLEQRLTNRMGGMFVIAVGVIISAIKYL